MRRKEDSTGEAERERERESCVCVCVCVLQECVTMNCTEHITTLYMYDPISLYPVKTMLDAARAIGSTVRRFVYTSSIDAVFSGVRPNG